MFARRQREICPIQLWSRGCWGQWYFSAVQLHCEAKCLLINTHRCMDQQQTASIGPRKDTLCQQSPLFFWSLYLEPNKKKIFLVVRYILLGGFPHILWCGWTELKKRATKMAKFKQFVKVAEKSRWRREPFVSHKILVLAYWLTSLPSAEAVFAVWQLTANIPADHKYLMSINVHFIRSCKHDLDAVAAQMI